MVTKLSNKNRRNDYVVISSFFPHYIMNIASGGGGGTEDLRATLNFMRCLVSSVEDPDIFSDSKQIFYFRLNKKQYYCTDGNGPFVPLKSYEIGRLEWFNGLSTQMPLDIHQECSLYRVDMYKIFIN